MATFPGDPVPLTRSSCSCSRSAQSGSPLVSFVCGLARLHGQWCPVPSLVPCVVVRIVSRPSCLLRLVFVFHGVGFGPLPLSLPSGLPPLPRVYSPARLCGPRSAVCLSPLPSVCGPARLCSPRGSVRLSSPSLVFADWLVFAVRGVLFVSPSSQVFAVRLIFAVRMVLFVSPPPYLVFAVRLIFAVRRVLFVSPPCPPSICCDPARLRDPRGSVRLSYSSPSVCGLARLSGLQGSARLSPTSTRLWSGSSLRSVGSGSSLLPPPLFCSPVSLCGPWGPDRPSYLVL